MDLPLRCNCGTVRGSATALSPAVASGSRIVCYCDDCQAFACFLDRQDVMDRRGGTDIFQMPPAHVTITHGAETVRAVRLSDEGMIRWYASCCRTPIGNTMSRSGVPFVGIIHEFMDHSTVNRDDVLGPPVAKVQGKFAFGGVQSDMSAIMPLGLVARSLVFLVGGLVRRKHQPSAFFDAAGKPRVTPTILSTSEREALRERVRQLGALG